MTSSKTIGRVALSGAAIAAAILLSACSKQAPDKQGTAVDPAAAEQSMRDIHQQEQMASDHEQIKAEHQQMMQHGQSGAMGSGGTADPAADPAPASGMGGGMKGGPAAPDKPMPMKDM